MDISRPIRLSQSKWYRRAAVLMLIVGTPSAHAAIITCSGPTPAVSTASAPNGSYTIAPDAPVGTRLTDWTAWQIAGGGTTWVCESTEHVFSSTVNRASFSGSNLWVEDRLYAVYSTSSPGVGMIVEMANDLGGDGGIPPIGSGGGFPLVSTWFPGWATNSIKPNHWRIASRYAFVKTGPMTSGTVSVSGEVVQLGISEEPYNNPKYQAAINVSGSATFLVPSCTTPSVTVDLGTHNDSDFPSIGSRRGSNGNYSDFSIDLSTCYTHTTSISYALRPLDGQVTGMPGMMNLTAGSTARGVAVKLTDRSENPVAFNTDIPLNLASGSRYIMLRAWMQRIGWETFAGGSVQAQAEFTISYN